MRLNLRLIDTWRVNYRLVLPNFLLMLPLGYLMVVTYRVGGWPLELLFVAPLAALRWVFALLVAVGKVYRNGIKALLAGIDARDRYTYGHSVRVSRYALLLARQLKLPEDLTESIVHSALLHDLGKLGMPDEVLYKPVRLNSEELKTVRRHPVQGSAILLQAQVFPCVKDGILHHHERWDGQGYPSGLRSEEIPLSARVIAVADAYDAMTTDRPYRKALTHEQAVEEIRRMAGIQFDPKVSEAFLAVADRVRQLAAHLARRGDPFPGDVVEDLGDPLDGLHPHPQSSN
ncbi:MAG: HD-GYP domain-containing protein [Firmicutes bacterium]|nr:HD-GYP domain-containing protein [Bacillota bacterium]